jgi:hypothetical protein
MNRPETWCRSGLGSGSPLVPSRQFGTGKEIGRWPLRGRLRRVVRGMKPTRDAHAGTAVALLPVARSVAQAGTSADLEVES